MTSVAMPQLGESVSEGTVVRWLKAVGDHIAVDEPLFEVATDKVNTEIPSLYAGVIREILVPDGTTVPVGTELARIDGVADARVPVATIAAVAPAVDAAPTAGRNGSSGSRAHLHSPVVRRLAREHSIDLSAVHGTGPGGRITRTDLLALVGSAAPAPVAAPARTPAPVLAPEPAPLTGGSGVPFSPMRARVAANVFASKRMVADVFTVIEADMENVHAVRIAAREKFAAREGTSLTYLPFIARAAVEALRAFPAVNARIDGASLVFNDAVHLGIAVDLDEEGLVVPVIRNADGLTVTGLARAIAAAGTAARASKLPASDYSGSTFTITNNGSYGTLMTAPIINTPNVATLSTDVIEERVVPHDGGIAIRRRMYLCMSWDHRAFDGSTAGKFIARIKRELETRDWTTQL
jgi:2-oxoglutarate dehydrogenase E2 component (dihydrolipoamide succinyltransferase)